MCEETRQNERPSKLSSNSGKRVRYLLDKTTVYFFILIADSPVPLQPTLCPSEALFLYVHRIGSSAMDSEAQTPLPLCITVLPYCSEAGKKNVHLGPPASPNTQACNATHPADTRESEPTTTPPSNSTAMIVVCRETVREVRARSVLTLHL